MPPANDFTSPPSILPATTGEGAPPQRGVLVDVRFMAPLWDEETSRANETVTREVMAHVRALFDMGFSDDEMVEDVEHFWAVPGVVHVHTTSWPTGDVVLVEIR